MSETRSIKVLMISVRADHGGGPRYIELLMSHLGPEVEVHVACPVELPYWPRYEKLAPGRLRSIPHRKFSVLAALRLARYVSTTGIALIHSHGKGAGVYGRFLAAFTGTKCLHTPHGIHQGSYGPLMGRLYRWYENLTGRFVSKLVFVSADEQAAAANARLWRGRESVVVTNGVEYVPDKERVRLRGETRRKLGLAPDDVLALTISRFDAAKNMEEAYQVVRLSPSVQFIWVGHGADATDLQRRSENECVKNLRFVGATDDVRPFLAAADVYVSTSRWEGLPLAILEAMAMGVAIVASDVSGHGLLREHACGLLYPLGHPDVAANQLHKLVDDPRFRTQMAGQGREVQRKFFAIEETVRRVHEIYVDHSASARQEVQNSREAKA